MVHRSGRPPLGHRIAYGGDYSPEQWDPDTWRDDIALMRTAGVTLITLGVFSWADLEPHPGTYTFDWLDDVINALHDAGIAVDLATPTASPPPWMGHLHPDTLARDRDGHTMHWGSRNHFSPASATYRDYCARIVTQLVTRYVHHPAVVMWHIGNEYGQLCYSDEAATRFRNWLLERYHSIDALNDAWGTSFWSQRYGSFDEVIPPRSAPYLINPGLNLDYQRFSSDLMRDCLREQRDIIRAADPHAVITTNFMGFFPLVNYPTWVNDLDIISDDIYPDPTNERSYHDTALAHTLMRSLANGKPWMLMEQAVSAVNWRPHNVPKPVHQTRREALTAVARGARGICYFQWRASAVGSERFHSAMLPHQGPNTPHFESVCALGRELEHLSTVLPHDDNLLPHVRVALVFTWENWWATREPALPTHQLDAYAVLRRWFTALHDLGVTVDIVPPGPHLTQYDVVAVPNLYQANDSDVEALRAVSEAGHTLILGPFSGIAHGDGHIHAGYFPVPLADLTGTHGQQWVPLGHATQFTLGVDSLPVPRYADHITLASATATAVASFPADAPHGLANAPAVVHNPATDVWTLAADLDSPALKALFTRILPPDLMPGRDLPDGVEVISGALHTLIVNHTDTAHTVALASLAGHNRRHPWVGQWHDALTMTSYDGSNTVHVPAYDAVFLVAANALDRI
ncbi:beta-galactosidase [Jonesia denitrificans]|uniref:beta-galactosidase n=1 Tax=Jonesia denitrificans TaxID=43674 RepID=UPI00019BD13F|nr:beta-galactosidase [Jonesia denitrificans]ASE09350.1 beta-galactosidase [Jonesia denitrificans]QXB43890.1 beta-galactosidase [Jonesia denitrificans]